jgi:hypothetical protein
LLRAERAFLKETRRTFEVAQSLLRGHINQFFVLTNHIVGSKIERRSIMKAGYDLAVGGITPGTSRRAPEPHGLFHHKLIVMNTRGKTV